LGVLRCVCDGELWEVSQAAFGFAAGDDSAIVPAGVDYIFMGAATLWSAERGGGVRDVLPESERAGARGADDDGRWDGGGDGGGVLAVVEILQIAVD
jgi:hypothetical protein